MKILVTGATGAFGAPLCAELARRGADVFAMARREPARLAPGVRFIAGDVTEADDVDAAVAGADVVVHLAWLIGSPRRPEDAEAINLTGTRTVLAAMGRHGIGRLVFSSSVMAYGSDPAHPQRYREDEPLRPHPAFEYGVHKRILEAEIASSGIPAVVIRPGPVLGRSVRNAVTDFINAPALIGVQGEVGRWQVVHQEDVTRFLVDAALTTRTGTVNLAADDDLTLDEVGRLLGKPVRRLTLPALKRVVGVAWALRFHDISPAYVDATHIWPIVDVTRLKEEWGFRCGWSSADTFVDTRRSLRRYMVVGKWTLDRPAALAAPALDWNPDVDPLPGATLVPVGPAELRGEFDTPIHTGQRDWTRTNVGEAFPGAGTPLTLELTTRALRAGGGVVARLLAMPDDVVHESDARMVGVFGHRIYINVELARETGRRMPGTSAAEIDEQYLGIPLPDGFRHRTTVAEIRAGLAAARSGGPAFARFGTHVERSEAEALRLSMPSHEVAGLTDEVLNARLRCLADAFFDAHITNVVAAALSGGAVAALQRSEGRDAVALAGPELRSAGVLRGVDAAAALARCSPEALQILARPDDPDALDRLGLAAPELATAVRTLLADYGHRGPGELELANDVFADRPSLLLKAIHSAASAAARRGGTGASPAHPGRKRRMAATALLVRERARDAVARLTHQLRITARERGSRLVATGVLDRPDDVLYLTLDQILEPPGDAAAVVARRRDERTRLAGIDMPPRFSGTWEPAGPSEAAAGGATLSGIGVSPGRAQGRVRVIGPAADEDFDPGDVLVAHVTDVGHTALFAAAAAVITDIGGMMSHAAVVAREFGIPAVVGVDRASHRLTDGQIVEVDGRAGTVTVLSV